MLFIHPAVVPAEDTATRVAQVDKVLTTKATVHVVWPAPVELAQLQTGPSNAAQNQAAPGTSIGATPPISNPNNGSPVPPNPVGAAPPIPGDTSTTGNTYGTQQERSGANGVTAPVTPGVPGPGAGTAGTGGGGLAAPELATPPAGNVDTGSSSRNLSSPYNSSGSGAGMTGTGLGTTATPPSAGTTATPGTTPITPPPSTSGASGTR